MKQSPGLGTRASSNSGNNDCPQNSPGPAAPQLPTGPAWEAATLERNWAVVQIVPRPTPDNPDKTDKPAIDPVTRRWCGHEQAAVLTLAEAFDVARLARVYHPSSRFVLAYMPRLGSAMVCGDVDACAMPDGVPPLWLRCENDPASPLHTYGEWSPSGRGLRLLFKRAEYSRHTGEHGGIGLYAEGGKALTITFNRLTRDPPAPRYVGLAEPLQQHFAMLAERATESAGHPVNDHQAKSRGASETPYWFIDLDEEEQLEMVKEMLATLPEGAFPNRDPHAANSWFRIMCAVHDGCAGSEEALAIFDEWAQTRAGGNYDACGNEAAWLSLGKSPRPGAPITIGTLISLAQQHGWRRPLPTFSSNARRYSPEELAELDAGFLRGLAKRGCVR